MSANRVSPETINTDPPMPNRGPMSPPTAPKAWPGGAAMPTTQVITPFPRQPSPSPVMPSVTNSPGRAPAPMPQPSSPSYSGLQPGDPPKTK